MKLKLDVRDLFWWFWTVTLVFIIAALAGSKPGYFIVMVISAIQVIIFMVREKDVMAYPVQIRVAYFALTLTGFWAGGRVIFYVLLLLGTIMVVIFGRCSISMLLKIMPWNRNRAPRLV